MTINPNVVARFDDLDKAALVQLATRLQRSQADVLRTLVRETWKIIQEQDAHITPQETTRPRVMARRMTNSNHA